MIKSSSHNFALEEKGEGGLAIAQAPANQSYAWKLCGTSCPWRGKGLFEQNVLPEWLCCLDHVLFVLSLEFILHQLFPLGNVPGKAGPALVELALLLQICWRGSELLFQEGKIITFLQCSHYCHFEQTPDQISLFWEGPFQLTDLLQAIASLDGEGLDFKWEVMESYLLKDLLMRKKQRRPLGAAAAPPPGGKLSGAHKYVSTHTPSAPHPNAILPSNFTFLSLFTKLDSCDNLIEATH